MKTRLLPGLIATVLIIAAQGALALHALEHDPGAPQGKVCGTCVTASQLAAGSIDNHAGEPLAPARQLLVATASSGFESRHAIPVRQRGPPSST
jgi:hypothetical protein